MFSGPETMALATIHSWDALRQQCRTRMSLKPRGGLCQSRCLRAIQSLNQITDYLIRGINEWPARP